MSFDKAIDALQARLRRAEDKILRLREALNFYGDENLYSSSYRHYDQTDVEKYLVLEDKGKKARSALKETNE